jgi:uncharacterized protein
VRVVLDTNVVVSALLSPTGAPAALLTAWRDGRIETLSSPTTIAELARILERPRVARQLGWSVASRRDFLDSFASGSVSIVPRVALHQVSRDPDDDRFLELAIAGAADYIVSGDRHLLELGSYQGIPILTPARFLADLALE